MPDFREAVRKALDAGPAPQDLATVPLEDKPVGPSTQILPSPVQPPDTPFAGGGRFREAVRTVTQQETDLKARQAEFLGFLHKKPYMPPERAAEVARLSVATGFDPVTVDENLEDVRGAVESSKIDWTELVRSNRVLAEWLSDPVNHALARDDVAELNSLNWWLGKWGSNPIPWQQRFALATTAPAYTSQFMTPVVETEPGAVHKALSESVRQVQYSMRAQQAAREGRDPDLDGELVALRNSLGKDYGERDRFLGASVIGLARTLGYMGATWGRGAEMAGLAAGAAAATTPVTGPLGLAAAPEAAMIGFLYGTAIQTMYMEEGAAYDEYIQEMRRRGIPVDFKKAAQAAKMAGFINGVLEVPAEMVWARAGKALGGFLPKTWQVGNALEKATFAVAARRAIGAWLLNLGAESTTEALQRASTVIGREWTAKQGEGLPRWRELPAEMVQEFKGALESFWLMTLPGGFGTFLGHVGDAQRAEYNVGAWKRYSTMVQAIKTSERSPEKFTEVVKKTIEQNGHPETVYARIEQWDTHFQSAGVDPAAVAADVTGDPGAYSRAKAAGAEFLAIPFDRFTARIVPTPHLAGLVEDLKFEPTAQTGREAKEAEARGGELLEAARPGMEAEARAPAASTEMMIYQTVFDRLKEAGYSSKAADSQAKMTLAAYHALAQSSGVPIEEVLRRHKLPVIQREGLTPAPRIAPGPPPPPAVGTAIATPDSGEVAVADPTAGLTAAGSAPEGPGPSAPAPAAPGAAPAAPEAMSALPVPPAATPAAPAAPPSAPAAPPSAAGAEGTPEAEAQARREEFRKKFEEGVKRRREAIEGVVSKGERPVVLPIPSRPGEFVFVHQTVSGEAEPWRATVFVPREGGELEPIGHTTHRTYADAVNEAYEQNADLAGAQEVEAGPAPEPGPTVTEARWSTGAEPIATMPGEPFVFLDAPAAAADEKNLDLAFTEAKDRAKAAVWLIVDDSGQTIGYGAGDRYGNPILPPAPAQWFETQAEAQAAAEAWVETEEFKSHGPEVVASREAPAPAPDATPSSFRPETFAFSTADPNVQFPMVHEIVSLDDLVTSNDDSGNPNPAYPQELQQWNRAGAASKGQVAMMGAAETFDNFLTEQHALDRGTPITGPDDLVVESGNGRTIALRKAREAKTSGWHRYQAMVGDRAAELGLSTQGVKDPVLIRRRAFALTPEARVQFTRDANSRASREPGPVERAKMDAEKFTPELLETIPISEEGTLDQALSTLEGAAWLRQFLSLYPAAEWGRFVDSSGRIGLHGIAAIKLALFQRVFGAAGERILGGFTEVTGEQKANLEKALFGALPRLVMLRSAVESGALEPGYEIGEDMAAAAEAFRHMRRIGDSVDQYLGMGPQAAMFVQHNLTPFQQDLLRVIDRNARRGGRLATMLDLYAQNVLKLPPPQQVAIFAQERPSKESIWASSVAGLEQAEALGGAPGQGALFQSAPTYGALYQAALQQAAYPDLKSGADSAANNLWASFWLISPEGVDTLAEIEVLRKTPGNPLEFFTFNKRTTPFEKMIEARFALALGRDPEGFIRQYHDLVDVKGRSSTLGGRIINADEAKKLSPDFRFDGRLANAVHEVSSAFANWYYDYKLKQAPTARVLFLAGGAGAGKSTGLNAALAMAEYEIIYDSILSDYEKGLKKIQKAADTGRIVDILFVHRPVEAAVSGIIKRAKSTGRTAPMPNAARQHWKSQQALFKFAENYAFGTIWIVDNSEVVFDPRVKQEVKRTDVETLRSKAYTSEEEVLERAKRQFYADFAAGNIREDQLGVFAAEWYSGLPRGVEGRDSGVARGRAEGAAATAAVPPAEGVTPELRRAVEAGERIGAAPPGQAVLALEGADADRTTYEILKNAEVYFQGALHGSPVRGIERFSTEFIGSGEGSAAYGWGLYFASRQRVAEHYRNLADEELMLEYLGEPIFDLSSEQSRPLWAVLELLRRSKRAITPALIGAALNDVKSGYRGTIKGLEASVRALQAEVAAGDQTLLRVIENGKAQFTAETKIQEYREFILFLDSIAAGELTITSPGGQIYQVQIPDEAEYLDWDVSLVEQSPQVLAGLEAAGVVPKGTTRTVAIWEAMDEISNRPWPWEPKTGKGGELEEKWNRLDQERRAMPAAEAIAALRWTKGENLYDNLARELNSEKDASLLLRKHGIAGIRYMDWGAKHGARNLEWTVTVREPGRPVFHNAFVDRESADRAAENFRVAHPGAQIEVEEGHPPNIPRNFVVFHDADVQLSGTLYQGVFRGGRTAGRARLSTAFVGNGIGQARHGWGLYFAKDPAWAAYYARAVGKGTGGFVYRIEIPEDSELLNADVSWEKQPEAVRAKLEAAGFWEIAAKHSRYPDRDPRATVKAFQWEAGREIYSIFEREYGSAKAAAEALAAIGIPGMTYEHDLAWSVDGARTDQMYLVWDDSRIEVVKYAPSGEAITLAPEEQAAVEEELVIRTEKLAGYEKELEAYKALRAEIGAEEALRRQPRGQHLRKWIIDEQTRIEKLRGKLEVAPTVHELRAAQDDLNGPGQPPRGAIHFDAEGNSIMSLYAGADMSTFLHESGHLYLRMLSSLAQEGTANPQLRADYETILNWLGFTSHEDLRAAEARVFDAGRRQEAGEKLSPEEQAEVAFLTEKLEKFARGFERYLFEGKAPSAELAAPFERFRSWLLALYRNLSALNVDLTDDVRGVFDRLLATEEEIGRLEASQFSGPIFESAEAAGMTEEEFKAYRDTVERHRREARDRVQAEIVAERRKQLTKTARAEREKLREAVTYETDLKPEYQALHFLRTGRLFGQEIMPAWLLDERGRPLRLSGAILDEMYGDRAREVKRRLAFTWQKEGGVHPDVIASAFGFKSGDEMIERLMLTPPRGRAIAQEVNRRFREQNGDLLTDGRMADAAAEAFEGAPARLQKLVAEIRALHRRSGRPGVPTPADVLRMAAREQIRKLRVQELKPGFYLRTMAKAARRTFEAFAAGDYNAAYAAKIQELQNHFLYLEARDAREATDKARNYAFGLSKGAAQARLGKAGANYQQQINDLLQRFDFAKVTLKTIARRQSLREWYEEQVRNGLDPVVSEKLLNDSFKVNWKELTVEELLGLEETLRNIAHLAGLKNSLLVGQQRKALELAVAELVGQLRQTYKDAGPMAIDEATRKGVENAIAALQRGDAALLKIEELLRRMDGDRVDGPWHRYVWNVIADAQAAENDLSLEYTKRLLEVFEKLPAKYRDRLFGEEKFIKGLGQSLTFQAMIAVALNTGNESNYRKMLQGRPRDALRWDEQVIEEILGHLSREDWLFVQNIWDTLESLWPRIESLEKRLTGTVPKKVTPKSFVRKFADGTELKLAGGYYPVVYDKKQGGRAGRLQETQSVADLFDWGYARAATPHSHTLERIEDYAEPIRLTIGVVARHLQSVIHDLTHREAILSVYKVLTNPEVASAMYATIGEAYTDQFIPWLKAIANNRIVDDRADKFWTNFIQKSRFNAAIVGIGFRFSTMWQNIANFANGAEVAGAGPLAEATALYLKDPMAWTKEVHRLSGEMRHRFNNLERDLADQFRALLGKRGIDANARRFAYYGMAMTDRLTAYPTWIAIYRRELGRGESEEFAIRKADEGVRLAFGSGATKDLAAIQRGSEAMKLITVFYTFFSAIYNRGRAVGYDARLAAQEGRIVQDFPRLLGRTLAIWLIPALMSEILSGRGPQEDEPWWKWGIVKALLWPALAVPFVRDVASALEGGRDFKYSPAANMGDSALKLIRKTKAYAVDEGELWPVALDAFKTSGYIFGLPTGQAATTADYLYDVWTGEESPENPAQAARDFMFTRYRRNR